MKIIMKVKMKVMKMMKIRNEIMKNEWNDEIMKNNEIIIKCEKMKIMNENNEINNDSNE